MDTIRRPKKSATFEKEKYSGATRKRVTHSSSKLRKTHRKHPHTYTHGSNEGSVVSEGKSVFRNPQKSDFKSSKVLKRFDTPSKGKPPSQKVLKKFDGTWRSENREARSWQKSNILKTLRKTPLKSQQIDSSEIHRHASPTLCTATRKQRCKRDVNGLHVFERLKCKGFDASSKRC